MKKTLFSLALLALLTSSGLFAAGANQAIQQPDVNPLGIVQLASGPDSSADGYLSITVDDLGAWGDFGAGEAPDTFNPVGSENNQLVSFTAGFFLFVADRGQRELLSQSPNWQATYGPDDSLDTTVLFPNSASDTNGDGVDDAAISQFMVQGGDTDLMIDLSQQITASGGVATMTQVYTIVNNSSSSVNLELVRSFDGDLIWEGDFSDDEVGTETNGGTGPVSVFMQEAANPGVTGIRMSSECPESNPEVCAVSYYAGKNGVEPGDGPPPYGFGTDLQIWDNFGLPMSWRNHVAGVGYNTDGVSGTNPPGTIDPADGFMGLQIPVTIEAGATETVTVTHEYGVGGGSGNTGLDFTLTGTCPGTITLDLSGGTPNGAAAILNSTSLGNDPLGGGPCAGTPSELVSPGVLSQFVFDASGNFSLTRSAPAASCSFFVQAVDGTSCETSGALAFP